MSPRPPLPRPTSSSLAFSRGNDILPAAPRETEPENVPYVDTISVPTAPWLRSVDWLRARLSGSLFFRKIGLGRLRSPMRCLQTTGHANEHSGTTFFYLATLDSAVRRHDGQLVIVLYPSMLQVNTPDALTGAGCNLICPSASLAISPVRQIHSSLCWTRARPERGATCISERPSPDCPRPCGHRRRVRERTGFHRGPRLAAGPRAAG